MRMGISEDLIYAEYREYGDRQGIRPNLLLEQAEDEAIDADPDQPRTEFSEDTIREAIGYGPDAEKPAVRRFSPAMYFRK